jgi:hypothetical protein
MTEQSLINDGRLFIAEKYSLVDGRLERVELYAYNPISKKKIPLHEHLRIDGINMERIDLSSCIEALAIDSTVNLYIPRTSDGHIAVYNYIFRSYKWRVDDRDNIGYIPKKRLRSNLCPYCHRVSKNKLTCYYSGDKLTAPCKECLADNAPMRRAPHRAQPIVAKGKKVFAIWPDQVKKNCYYCEVLNEYIDKHDIAYDQKREHAACLGYCISKLAAKNGVVKCDKCDCGLLKSKKNKVKGKYRCHRCLNEAVGYQPKHIDYVPADNSKNLYGIEVEINDIVAIKELAEDIAAINISGLEFGVWSDGSIHSGFEIVSKPASKELLLKGIKEVCNIINEYPHSYEKAGIHVHVSSPVAPHKLFRTWLALERFAYSFLPASRKHAEYVRYFDLDFDSFKHISNLDDAYELQKEFDSKYCSINLGNWFWDDTEEECFCEDCDVYDSYGCDCGYIQDMRSESYGQKSEGTVEFRAHHATADYSSIYNWIMFLDHLIEFSASADDETLERLFNLCRRPIGNSKAICKLLKLHKSLSKFIADKQFIYNLDSYEAEPLLNKNEKIFYGLDIDKPVKLPSLNLTDDLEPLF